MPPRDDNCLSAVGLITCYTLLLPRQPQVIVKGTVGVRRCRQSTHCPTSRSKQDCCHGEDLSAHILRMGGKDLFETTKQSSIKLKPSIATHRLLRTAPVMAAWRYSACGIFVESTKYRVCHLHLQPPSLQPADSSFSGTNPRCVGLSRSLG